MSTLPRPQLRRLARRRRNGQSIPIIAIMILVLVAMVGLSVDVGNTFSHERQATSASNAASIAAMTTYIKRATNAIKDGDVYKSITDSLAANGITVGDGTNGTVQLSAYYLNSQGETLTERPTIIEGSTQSTPENVGFIQIKLNGKVDTSFARVVGRNDLPINATAHAGLCPINSGVYPLSVDSATITGDQFNNGDTTGAAPEYTTVSGGTYDGYIQRRIYLKDGNTAGSFVWLRWMENKGALGMSATSGDELTASLVGAGNIASGFQEAPWPNSVSEPPAGYPLHPGTLEEGDWAWGSPGWENNSTLDSALDQHILNETKMILPIYTSAIGTGSDVQVRVNRLGAFVITGKGKTSGGGPYLDMVYLGKPVRQYTACSVTAPPPADTNLELFGNVSFFPEYQIKPSQQDPIQYVVVLDASGSMSANFNGQCDNTGVVQCANGPPGAPDVAVTGTGPTYYWSNQSQRRIYVAKKALDRLVSLTNMDGNAGYTTTRPPDQMGVVWFNESISSNQATTFSSTPTAVKNTILHINNGNGDYRSQGGTNGAGGLYRASLMYGSAPKTVTDANGKVWNYKRVVLYISDGVSNNFLNTGAGNLNGGSSNAGTYENGSYCKGLGSLVVESASCQTTDVGKKYNGWDRPITQMINTSANNLRNTTVNASVFVIALSSIPSTGLKDGVASSTNYFFSAESLTTDASGKTNVDGIIDTINAAVEQGDCIPGPSGSSTGTINSSEFVDGTGGYNYPTVGEVVIYNSTNTLTAPIIAGTNGALTYYFPKVPQGTYRLEAQLYYHHPLDPPNVMRKYSKIWSAGQAISDFTVDVSPSSQSTSFSQRKEQPLTLKLQGDVCPAL